MISSRNKDYIWSFSEVFKHPLDPLMPHLNNTISLYTLYISIPVILFAIIGFVLYLIKKNKKESWNLPIIIVSLWWILPLLANAGVAKVFTARYILFTLPALLILISISFFKLFKLIKSNLITIILFICIFILNINFIYKISTNPFNQKLVANEQGYLSDWTSGWGIQDISVYLKQRSLEKNVIVGTEGAFGTLPDGLQIYTNNTKQLTVFGVGLGFTKIPEKLIDAKNYGDEVYLVINQSRLKLLPEEMNKVEIIKEYQKPNNDKLLLIKI
jgi:hypothetical protein